ncbi:hypothetical protein ACNTMW_33600 [Planosporangium sp. 12N6]|uniref:hypothetical protein n=1 Tax=Planosporangium spinosum TaxID=3402278 RepID=UPI003CF7E791
MLGSIAGPAPLSGRAVAFVPAEGFQHFGEVDIDRHSRALTVRLRDLGGAGLWTRTLPAA